MRNRNTEMIICNVCDQPEQLKNCKVETYIGPGAHFYQFYTCASCQPHLSVRDYWQLPTTKQQSILEEIESEDDE